MNNNNFDAAFEMVKDGCAATVQEPVKRSRSPLIRYIALALAALVLLAVILPPALTAVGSDLAYDLLYSQFPAAAQNLKPVKTSCEDNGIRLDTVKAVRKGSNAEIYLTLTDLEGGILTGKVEPSGENIIRTAFDSYVGCGCQSFNEADSTANLLALILSADGEDIPDGKVTITFSHIMTMPEDNSFPVSVDISSLFRESEMKAAGQYACDPLMEKSDGTVCADETGLIFDSGKGAAIVSSCFCGDRLHIKTRGDDFSSTKNRAIVYFANESGEKISYVQDITYDDSKRGCRYEEYLFDVTPEQLEGFTLYFDTVTSEVAAEGDWQVTVPLS